MKLQLKHSALFDYITDSCKRVMTHNPTTTLSLSQKRLRSLLSLIPPKVSCSFYQ